MLIRRTSIETLLFIVKVRLYRKVNDIEVIKLKIIFTLIKNTFYNLCIERMT